jgi:uroporphyrinogen decarboxylase
MTAKENALAMYSHQKIDHMPLRIEGETGIFPINGFLERPANNQSGKDWFNCNWEFSEAAGAPAPDQYNHLMSDICDWKEIVKFPDLDTWDWEKAVKIDKIEMINREEKAVNVLVLTGLFERLHVLMGFEDALCALLMEPEHVADFLDAMTDYKIKLIDKIAQYYKPDIITYHDDWGTQRGPFFSPETWRELIKPRTKRIIDAAHKHNILFVLHSCGKYDELIPEITEIGVDCLQCMDIMDIGKALEITDGKMSFQVSVHAQEFETKNSIGALTEEYVRKTVRKEFYEWGKTGRYFAFISPPSKWYQEVVYDEYKKVSLELKGTYFK